MVDSSHSSGQSHGSQSTVRVMFDTEQSLPQDVYGSMVSHSMSAHTSTTQSQVPESVTHDPTPLCTAA